MYIFIYCPFSLRFVADDAASAEVERAGCVFNLSTYSRIKVKEGSGGDLWELRL